MAVFAKFVVYKSYFNSIVEWSGRHSTPAGSRGKAETPQAKPREAQLPLRGKRVSGEQWNELIFTFTLQQNMQKQFISLIAWGWA